MVNVATTSQPTHVMEEVAFSFKIDDSNEFYLQLAREIHETAKTPGDYTEKADKWKAIVETLPDESFRRYFESRVNVLIAASRRYNHEYDDAFTAQLLGTEAFDGLVFDDNLKNPVDLQDLLAKSADPNARDSSYGFTPSHAMAWSASLMSAFPESWHLDRLRNLRKAGGDIRCAVDIYGRSPLLLALENSNVQFVKSILRVSLGEHWALHQLRSMQLFTPGGKLIKKLLDVESMNSAGAGPDVKRKTRAGFGVPRSSAGSDIKALMLQGSIRPNFRMPAQMLSGVHWAALHNDAPTIHILVHLDLPVNLQSDVIEPHAEFPLMLACSLGNFDAVQMLLQCNADPLLQNSAGENAFDVAQKTDSEARQRLTELLHVTYPLKQPVLWGHTLCWDSVGVLAKLFEKDFIEVSSMEEVCYWYQELGVEPQERVAAFWTFAAKSLGPDGNGASA